MVMRQPAFQASLRVSIDMRTFREHSLRESISRSGALMYEIPLDDIHRLLEKLEEARPKIKARPTKDVQVHIIPELSEVVLEVLDWTNTAYIENKLGVSPALLSKFVKMRGVVSKNQALRLAERLRTYLRSEDQRTDNLDSRSTPVQEPPQPPQNAVATERVRVSADAWVSVAFSSETKAKIAVISSLLDSIIEQISRANAPEEEQALTQLERQQLIMILETALAVLKAPMVERGILKTAQDVLQKGAKSAAEKSMQQSVGSMMQAASEKLGELIRLIFTLL